MLKVTLYLKRGVVSAFTIRAFQFLMEFLMDAPDENILGHIIAPWAATKSEYKEKFEHAFRDFKAARAHFYPDR